MKVGDLVRIKPYCYCGGEIGVMLTGPDELNAVIVFVSTSGKLVGSLAANLEKIA
jgi:hypothetical protein